MAAFDFALTEHDPNKPWIVTEQQRCSVDLDDGQNFFEWAHERWPPPQWTLELDPWALSPK